MLPFTDIMRIYKIKGDFSPSFKRFDDCVEGGESIIIDTYPIIEEFRIKHPKQFDVLTRVPYTPKIEHHSLDRKSVDYLIMKIQSTGC